MARDTGRPGSDNASLLTGTVTQRVPVLGHVHRARGSLVSRVLHVGLLPSQLTDTLLVIPAPSFGTQLSHFLWNVIGLLIKRFLAAHTGCLLSRSEGHYGGALTITFVSVVVSCECAHVRRACIHCHAHEHISCYGCSAARSL